MLSTINTALTLLVIGMTSVFFILALVVGSGKVLILLVNRFFPAEKASGIPILQDQDAIPKSKIAVIMATVDQITQGKGVVIDIKKIQNG